MMKSKDNRRQKERGQALVLIAFSIITLVAFVGLGVDLGMVYVAKVRVQRAADAAALAAAADLPLQPAARLRALEYLAENSYDCGLTVVGTDVQCLDPRVHVSVDGAENFEDDPDNAAPTSIVITTMDHENNPNPPADGASRIRVRVTEQVDVYFMKLLGFKTIPVTGVASAENIVNLDIVLAFDKSGSMEFDTLCYGCWTPDAGVEYPSGNLWPLRWDGSQYGPPAHCAANTPWPYKSSGKIYTLIEAEEYSAISNAPRRYAQGYTYWVLQRNGKITEPNSGYLMNGSGAAARGRDLTGAYIGHFPFRTGYVVDGGTPSGAPSPDSGASGVPCVWEDVVNGICRSGTWITEHSGPYPAPRVDFDFALPATTQTGGNNNWYVWIRAQGGDRSSDPNDGQGVFWGLDGNLLGRGSMPSASSWKYNGANAGSWSWRRLQRGATGGGGNTMGLVSGGTVTTHTLNIWGGSAGFTIDQIVITNDSGDITDSKTKNMPRDTRRTNQACDPCDARFGGSPDGDGGEYVPRCDEISGASLPPEKRYRYEDPIFDDEQPLASTAAAATRFLRRLDYGFDQVGLVRYSSKADSSNELLCIKSNGAGCTKNVIENNITGVLMDRQQTFADGSTNIPDALENAIKMLDNVPPHYGRPSAAHIIVLMTDGQPNTYEYLDNANKNCYSSDLYTVDDDPAKECSMYMAARARDKGIVIYGITLGEGADRELMAEITRMTGGEHLHAESPEALDGIFEYLYNRLFLRLVE